MTEHDAGARIDEIHRRLAVTTGFDGFKPLFLCLVAGFGAVACGVIALAGITAEPIRTGTLAIAWLVTAGAVLLLTAVFVIAPALREQARFVRESAKHVTVQLVPVLIVGLAVSLLIIREHPGAIAMLPAVWSAVMGIGIVSMAPYLPRRTPLASIWYFAAAAVGFRLAPGTGAAFNLIICGVFSTGHLLTAVLIAERRS